MMAYSGLEISIQLHGIQGEKPLIKGVGTALMARIMSFCLEN